MSAIRASAIAYVPSPLGELLLSSDGEALTGLWFRDQRYAGRGLGCRQEERSLPVFDETAAWLDCYFSGRQPDFAPMLSPQGTEFQQRVWAGLRRIPYGNTLTYGELARRLAPSAGMARAVGGAVARNPICLIIPCHRVVGRDGLTGYAGGLERQRYLLELEQGRGGART